MAQKLTGAFLSIKLARLTKVISNVLITTTQANHTIIHAMFFMAMQALKPSTHVIYLIIAQKRLKIRKKLAH